MVMAEGAFIMMTYPQKNKIPLQKKINNNPKMFLQPIKGADKVL